jgi:hypothetical protein
MGSSLRLALEDLVPRALCQRALVSSAIVLACVAGQAVGASARQVSEVSLSPAHADTSGALRYAARAIEAASIKNLVATHRLKFSFRTAAGTCPPGTNDGSYCVGAAGRLLFSLLLHESHGRTLRAADVRVRFAARSRVRITARLDRPALAALRLDRRNATKIRVTLSCETIISAASYYAEKRTVQLR